MWFGGREKRKSSERGEREKGYYKIVVMANRRDGGLEEGTLVALCVTEDKKGRTVIDSERVDRIDG